MRETAKITAIYNQKGGVGKTVIAVNLGIGLAREGKRILWRGYYPPRGGRRSPSCQHRAKVTLVNTMSRETILREYLNSVRDQYDVILLDCCLSLSMLTINALAAADEVMIPLMAHYLSIISIKGMEQLIRTLSNVIRKRKENVNESKQQYF